MRSLLNKAKSEQGIALVITLVMLALVTVMAIVFLALTRRERGLVMASADLATANYMAEAAAERAKAQAISSMYTSGSKLHYDLYNSTNFLAPAFVSQGNNRTANPTNVSYFYADGSPVTGDDYLQLMANLQYDPRPPVFVQTNDNGSGELRFYLDFNRNGIFEGTGLLPPVDNNGRFDTNLLHRYVGDPQWIGILERPDLPHSETNRFIGRIAYLVLPAGKTLDLNFIHNQSNPNSDNDLNGSGANRNGFSRNQGYGSWEINLAAFFRDLNTNTYAWHPFSYDLRLFQPGQFPRGEAFDDARQFLNLRYNGLRSNLRPAFLELGPNEFERDYIDNYADGPVTLGPSLTDDDNTPADKPWPGSLNTNAISDIQQLFSFGPYSPGFTNRLRQPMAPNRLSSYDRYTYYRLLSQLGVDSKPALGGKLHLNYYNAVGQVTNQTIPWTAVTNGAITFFTNAADLMLKNAIYERVDNLGQQTFTNLYVGDTKVRREFGVTNILVHGYPYTNANGEITPRTEYTPAVHRFLQVAANIYDNMTNRSRTLPDHPSIFRPIFFKTATNITIAGFVEEQKIDFVSGRWEEPAAWLTNRPGEVGLFTNVNLYGQPIIVGARKGHPNFNEVTLETVAEVSRKIELGKRSAPSDPITVTNQQFLITLSNRWGLEAWNSYSAEYGRPVRIFAEIQSEVVLSNTISGSIFSTRVASFNNLVRTAVNVDGWPGYSVLQPAGSFQIPISTNLALLRDAVFTGTPPNYFAPTNAPFQPITEPPNLHLWTTNRVRFWITDNSGGTNQGRIIDFVNLNDLRTFLDIGSNLRPRSGGSVPGQNQVSPHELFWDTNRVGSGNLTVGITNQIAMSLGELPFSTDDRFWRSYRLSSRDRERSIDLFRAYHDLPPLFSDNQLPQPQDLNHQAPFVPTRKLYARYSWQANDPLVHYLDEDLRKPGDLTGLNPPDEGVQPLPPGADTSDQWNIGFVNQRAEGGPVYRPWATGNYAPGEAIKAMIFRDPNIRGSDDWKFPINTAPSNYVRFPSIGWLGRVHRGTPWQTIFLKSIYRIDADQQKPVALLSPQEWYQWAGSVGTFPLQDYKIFDVFTVAANEAAATGLLSVNQTNQAAWSAVLSGISVFTNSIPDRDIVGPQVPDPYDPEAKVYSTRLIEPASPHITNIVASINFARTNQFDIMPIRDRSRPQVLFDYQLKVLGNRPLNVFEHVGDLLSAPALSLYSPYLRSASVHPAKVWVDEAVERIPQQVLSLVQRDEPRFVIYAYGQSLKPAPNSVATTAAFYNICTNYQITGEVVTKTVFRVEGSISDPRAPLRAVVESYNVLPPAE